VRGLRNETQNDAVEVAAAGAPSILSRNPGNWAALKLKHWP
jgi:hypothetical protein